MEVFGGKADLSDIVSVFWAAKGTRGLIGLPELFEHDFMGLLNQFSFICSD